MILRLRTNHFIGGEFTLAGTEIPFTKEEAQRRLKKTQLWDIV